MNLGRFTSGQFVPLPVHTRSGNTPYAPPTAPLATIYNSSGTKLDAFLIPPVDKGAVTGAFVGKLRLDSSYPIGHYNVTFNFTANSVKQLKVAHFEVVDGGHVDGAVISMVWYPRPHANFLVEKLDSQQRLLIKNPRVP